VSGEETGNLYKLRGIQSFPRWKTKTPLIPFCIFQPRRGAYSLGLVKSLSAPVPIFWDNGGGGRFSEPVFTEMVYNSGGGGGGGRVRLDPETAFASATSGAVGESSRVELFQSGDRPTWKKRSSNPDVSGKIVGHEFCQDFWFFGPKSKTQVCFAVNEPKTGESAGGSTSVDDTSCKPQTVGSKKQEALGLEKTNPAGVARTRHPPYWVARTGVLKAPL